MRLLAIRDNIHFLSHVVDMCTYETITNSNRHLALPDQRQRPFRQLCVSNLQIVFTTNSLILAIEIAVEMANKPPILHFCMLLGANRLTAYLDHFWSSAVFNWCRAIYVLRWRRPLNLPYCTFASYWEPNNSREWTQSSLRPFLGHGGHPPFSTGVV